MNPQLNQLIEVHLWFRMFRSGGGGGDSPRKLGGAVQPASQHSYPIYDQNLRYPLPYL